MFSSSVVVQKTTLGANSPCNPPFISSASIRRRCVGMSFAEKAIGSTPRTIILAVVVAKTPQSEALRCLGPPFCKRVHSLSIKASLSSSRSHILMLANTALPISSVIDPLTVDWEDRLADAMRNGISSSKGLASQSLLHTMTMNFVTFNQDYSHLAIGMMIIYPRSCTVDRIS